MLRPTPPTSSTAVRGLGILVTAQAAPGEPPTVLGRIIVSGTTASPRHQFALVRTLQQHHPGVPDYYALIHDATAEEILIQELNADTDPHDEPTASTFITLDSNTGVALAALDHTTEDLCVLWSEASLADNLGIGITTNNSPYVSSGAVITGTELGFSADQIAYCHFTGFVARENEEGHIVVLAGLQDLSIERSSPGEIESFTMVVFTIDPTDNSIVATQTQVDVAAPFTPHQLAEGPVVGLNGTVETRLWCAGRNDPETLNQAAPGVTTMGNEGGHNLAAEGIWICVADTPSSLSSWQQLVTMPFAVSHDVRGHTTPTGGDVTRPPAPRDLGLAYDSAWQQLTLFGIDTDPSQDPLLERPTY